MISLRTRYRFFFCLLLCTLLSCEDRDALPIQALYPFTAVRKIDVSVSDSLYKLYVSKPIDVIPQAYDQDGKRVYLPDSLITIWINGQPQKSRSVIPPDTGSYVVEAKFGKMESAPVKVQSVDVIQSIQVLFSRPTFYLREETTPIVVSAIVRDREGVKLKLTDEAQLTVFVNGVPLTGNDFLPTSTGNYNVQVRLRQHASPSVLLPVVDPNSVVRTILLTAHTLGGTNLGVSDRPTRFDLRAEIVGNDGQPVPLSKEIGFYANGSALADASFTTSSAGTYVIQAKGYGVASESITITVRPDRKYPVVKLPVVLHFINQPVPIQSELDQLLDNVNRAFRGANIGSAAQDLNAVDSYVEFEWATRSPEGSILERPGVHVVTTGQESFPHKIVTEATTANPCWNNFWNPNKYLNVWVLKVSDGPWGGLGAYSPLGDTPISEKPPFLVGTWVNTTVALNAGVLIHEFGHNFGLGHTFNGNPAYGEYSSAANSCARDSDACEDTPNYHRGVEVTFSSSQRVSCEGVEFQSTNFMDYGPGENNSFTYDQRKIIRQTTEKALWLPIPRNRNARLPAGWGENMRIKPPIILP